MTHTSRNAALCLDARTEDPEGAAVRSAATGTSIRHVHRGTPDGHPHTLPRTVGDDPGARTGTGTDGAAEVSGPAAPVTDGATPACRRGSETGGRP